MPKMVRGSGWVLLAIQCHAILGWLSLRTTTLTDFHLNGQNAELFTLTYGAMVMQLIRDYEDLQAVNTQLEKMCVRPTNYRL